MQNQGGLPLYQQGTAVQAHLPADALRVLPPRSPVHGQVEDEVPVSTPVPAAGATAP
jgi:hypothetical protein